jgi:hypothetical protein
MSLEGRRTAMRRTARPPYPRLRRRRRLLLAALPAAAVLLTAALACSKSNPVAPAAPEPGSPGGSASGTYTLRLTLSPPSLAPGGAGTLTLEVRRKSDLAPPADGSAVSLNTDLGHFGLNGAGKPVQSATATLSGGNARVSYFAGDELGTAEVLALFQDSTGSVSVPVTEPGVPAFFVERVEPDVGSGQGGQKVTISGRGFTEPLRVTFGDAVAQVVSVSDAAVVAKTPPPVPFLASGETRRVDVAVTIDLDEEAPRTDTLPGGFVYTQGGGPLNQPVVFSIDPTQGSNDGGDPVEILGQGFEDDARVYFGFAQGAGFDGVEADVVAGSRAPDGSSLTVRTPPASGAGRALLNQTVDVRLENPRTGLAAVASAVFRYGGGSGGGMLITDVSPRQAAYTGLRDDGKQVTVTLLGQGFGTDAGDLRVTLAGVDQGPPATLSDTELTVSLEAAQFSFCSPPRGPARVTNVVTGDAAASDLDFEYTVEQPRLTGLAPGSGPAAGGTEVTVSGSGLLGTGVAAEPVDVTFDGVRAAVGSVAAGAVTAAAPAFTGTFPEEDCDDNDDGVAGKRSLPQAVDVVFVNRASGCSDTLARAFSYEPADTTCRESDTTPPELIADFTFVVSGLKVTFKNTTQGAPTSFFWDFGDGETGIETTQEDPIHTYAMPGTYPVQLFVEDAAGQQDSVTKSVTVN